MNTATQSAISATVTIGKLSVGLLSFSGSTGGRRLGDGVEGTIQACEPLIPGAIPT
jgi:hypothetical protein